MKVSRRINIWIPVLVLAGGAAVFISCSSIKNPANRAWLDPEYRAQVKRFGEALWLAEYAYYDAERTDYAKLTEAAIAGMAKSLDPHSDFLPPDALKAHRESKGLKYAGAGFKTREIEGEIVVTHVFPGSPSEEADIRLGDRVLTVDGETTSGKSVQDCLRLIRGPVGTDVSLKVRGASGDVRTLRITRAQIQGNPIDDYWVDPDGNGYVRLVEFTKRAGKQLRKALKKMQAQGMRRIVLDLRGNPGGDLEVAVEVAGYFLPPDQVVTSVQGKLPELKLEFRSKDQGIHIEIPMAVLINENSASGAECLAGALKVHGRAILVGEKTKGKGTGQQLIPVSHGSGFRLTTIKYKLPDGSNID